MYMHVVRLFLFLCDDVAEHAAFEEMKSKLIELAKSDVCGLKSTVANIVNIWQESKSVVSNLCHYL
jgi:hypothetical protein